jgi:hypothetical protein
MVMVLLALCLLGTASPGADGGFIPALSFLAVAVVAVHVGRGLRASPVTAGRGR